MEIKAHFTHIGETIQEELNASQTSITAAIAWLTDPELFNALVRAARRGVLVRIALLDDVINRRAALARENLTAVDGHCYWIPETGKSEGSLHHKFCVIDGNIVITGSYNWTRRAGRAEENIMVVQGDPKLAAGYVQAFEALLQKYGHTSTASPIDSRLVQKRLEVILNLLLLEDYATIKQQLPHLEAARAYQNIPLLLDAIKLQNWADAEHQLRDMLAKGMAIMHYESPENAELRLALRTLETQIIALTTEQIETEQLIEQFSKRQNSIIGDILGQYLNLRELVYAKKAQKTGKTEDNQAFEAAKEENESYQQSHDPSEGVSPLDALTPEQQTELKRLFQQANMLCHPDRVSEAEKLQAQAVFAQVQQARKNANLATLRRLYKNLKEGKPFDDPAEMPTEVDQLRRQVARLRLEVERYIAAINELRKTDTFQTLSELADWDSHFAEARQQLESECEKFRAELGQDAP
jgi:HAMP domain-containing protein